MRLAVPENHKLKLENGYSYNIIRLLAHFVSLDAHFDTSTDWHPGRFFITQPETMKREFEGKLGDYSATGCSWVMVSC